MPGILLGDDLSGLRDGPVHADLNPYNEFHAVADPPDAKRDGWTTQTSHWSLPDEIWWRVTDADGRGWLESRLTAGVFDNMLMTKGDIDWQDYGVDCAAQFLPADPEARGGPRGVAFRCLTTQHYYAFVLDADGCFKILKRVEAGWDVLARSGAVELPAGPVRLTAEMSGAALACRVEELSLCLEAVDHEYAHGRIGVIGASPIRIGDITVTGGPEEGKRLAAACRERDGALSAKRSRYPRPRVWRQIETVGFGGYRTYRFGDLSGDGVTDILVGQRAEDRSTRCLTAITLEGDVLWQVGEPVSELARHTGDIPAQVHDLDGDGRNEVVCVFGKEIRVLEGATGKVLRTAPAPRALVVPDYYKEVSHNWGGRWGDEDGRLPIDGICFADLSGRGRRGEILVKDEYHHIAALDSDLGLLWQHLSPQGHYPLPFDFEGVGREDVIAGYSRLSPEGECRWALCLTDHQDAIYAGTLSEDGSGPIGVLMAGGEDGLVYVEPGGACGQRVMGHVQRLAVGKFREDVRGLQVATCLFHGNPGIISLFDSSLQRLWTKEFPVAGATLHPVNWTGTGEELIFYSGGRPAMGFLGGMLDGWGDLVVEMPDDGGPGETWEVLAFPELAGDWRDRLVTWDRERIWIYEPDAPPPPGRVYRPERPKRSCASNYQSVWSRPRWG